MREKDDVLGNQNHTIRVLKCKWLRHETNLRQNQGTKSDERKWKKRYYACMSVILT
jgi:hypothetical protein